MRISAMIYGSEIQIKLGRYRISDWDEVSRITEQAKELKEELTSLIRDSIQALKEGKMARCKALISVTPHVIETMEKEIEKARAKLEAINQPLNDGDSDTSVEITL
jgi:uncharacterized protein YicC (UPF0701 family)